MASETCVALQDAADDHGLWAKVDLSDSRLSINAEEFLRQVLRPKREGARPFDLYPAISSSSRFKRSNSGQDYDDTTSSSFSSSSTCMGSMQKVAEGTHHDDTLTHNNSSSTTALTKLSSSTMMHVDADEGGRDDDEKMGASSMMEVGRFLMGSLVSCSVPNS